MTIEELRDERRIVEVELDKLKHFYDRMYDSVYLHNFREPTPEDKAMENAYNLKKEELDNLTVSQMRRVIETGDNSLIEDYYYFIPQEKEEQRLMLLPYARLRDGQEMGVLRKYITHDYLNGIETSPYYNADIFDEAMALFGADGTKIAFLDDILRIYGSHEIYPSSSQLTPIQDHIFKLLAGFSSQDISMEFFRCIFKFDEKNETLRENLYERFAFMIEHYQEQRIKYDSDSIENKNRIHGLENFYKIDIRSYYTQLSKLPELNKKFISELSLLNVERVRLRKPTQQMNVREMMNYLHSTFNLNEYYGVEANTEKYDEPKPDNVHFVPDVEPNQEVFASFDPLRKEINDTNSTTSDEKDQIDGEQTSNDKTPEPTFSQLLDEIINEPIPKEVAKKPRPVRTKSVIITKSNVDEKTDKHIRTVEEPKEIISTIESSPVIYRKLDELLADYEEPVTADIEQSKTDISGDPQYTDETDLDYAAKLIMDIIDYGHSSGRTTEQIAEVMRNNPDLNAIKNRRNSSEKNHSK